MHDHTSHNRQPTPLRLASTVVTRRRLLAGLGALGAATLGAAACGDVTTGGGSGGGSSGGKKLELTMFVFLGGDLGKMPKEFADEWQADHRNVTLKLYEQSNQVGYPKMVAQKQTDPTKPLVNLGFFNAQTTEQGILDQMWAPLDYAAMTNATDVRQQFKRDDGYGIGIGSDQIGLLYNTQKLTPKPTSWQALWDPANRGKVTLFGFPWYAVFAAAKLNGGGLDDMEPGWRAWQENAKNIRTLVTSNPEYLNVLASGTAPLTGYFNGTGNQWIAGGAPLEYVPPDEGAISVPVNLQVVAGQDSDHLAACHEIVDAMLSPKWCSRWAETSIEVPANTKSSLPSHLAGLPAFSEATVEKMLRVDYAIVGKNQSAWTDRWQRDVVTRM
ncbi:MAG TPA: extracellular solute-binding protein [Jiangellales bacterium]|nr:extracellular solute-binding protein [Jiangellales bacterium]